MNAYLNEVARTGREAPLEGIDDAEWERFQIASARSNTDLLLPGRRLDYGFDMFGGPLTFVEDKAPIEMTGGVAADFELRVERTGAPTGLAAPPSGPASDEVLGSLWGEVLDTFDEGQKKLPLKDGGKLGIVSALTGASFVGGMSEAEAQGYGTAGQIAFGVARTAVDVVEPVAVGFAMGQLGRPEDLGEAELPGLGPMETEFTRQQAIQASDRQQNIIDEQMSKIQQYDERKATIDEQMSRISRYDKRNGPDIEVKYPRGE